VAGESQWFSVKFGDNHNILDRVELALSTLYLFCLQYLVDFKNFTIFHHS
jgi:hypothetical protein